MCGGAIPGPSYLLARAADHVAHEVLDRAGGGVDVGLEGGGGVGGGVSGHGGG